MILLPPCLVGPFESEDLQLDWVEKQEKSIQTKHYILCYTIRDCISVTIPHFDFICIIIFKVLVLMVHDVSAHLYCDIIQCLGQCLIPFFPSVSTCFPVCLFPVGL